MFTIRLMNKSVRYSSNLRNKVKNKSV